MKIPDPIWLITIFLGAGVALFIVLGNATWTGALIGLGAFAFVTCLALVL